MIAWSLPSLHPRNQRAFFKNSYIFTGGYVYNTSWSMKHFYDRNSLIYNYVEWEHVH